MEAEPELLKITLRDNQLFISRRNKPVENLETLAERGSMQSDSDSNSNDA